VILEHGALMGTDELLDLLKRLYIEQDESLRNSFDRSLSFQDGAFDRWERSRRLGFGEGASIYNSALVFGNVQVGMQTWIGPFSVLDGSGGQLSIGSYCSISSGVHIYTHDTLYWALSGGNEPKRVAPVSIADRVYIGPQSVITAGVSIGEQSVVAANSFVNNNVEPGTVVAGTPARQNGVVVNKSGGIRIVFDAKP